MSREQIAAEISKLNKSQRNRMRSVVATALTKLCVEQVGWKTRVRCQSNGFQFAVDLGPRGAILSKEIWEV